MFDGDLEGGLPKGVELFAACDVPNLSRYDLRIVFNGGTTVWEGSLREARLPAGSFAYVSKEEDKFKELFGFAPTATENYVDINGDDAIQLFHDGTVIDTFGNVSVDGTNQAWEYKDGWASRRSGTGPDGPTFQPASWSLGKGNFKDEATNTGATSSMPVGQYTLQPISPLRSLASPSPSPPSPSPGAG